MLRAAVFSLLLIFCFLSVACDQSDPAGDAPSAQDSSAGPVGENDQDTAAMADQDCSITMGWDPWEPYQYMDIGGEVRGLDIELVTAIVKRSGCTVSFVERDWATLLGMLRDGSIDLLTGATKTDARDKFAYFSDPYRDETFVLYVRSEDLSKYQDKSLQELLSDAFRVGVTLSYVYGDEITALEDSPQFEMQFRGVPIGEMNYSNLLNFEIDGFLEDPFVAAAVLRKKGLLSEIEAHPIRYNTGEVHLMLSRASIDAALIPIINKNLETIKKDGTYSRIMARYGN